MINVRELRIANLLYDLNRRIFAVTPEDFIGANSYSPIPLTEEWLLRFGFKKAGTSFIHSCGLKYHSPGIQSGTTGYGNWFAWGIKPIYGVRYVHQLQNLYFALTGEELILKETE